MRLTLAASVALNFLFLAGLVVARVDPDAQTAAEFSTTGAMAAREVPATGAMSVDSVPGLEYRLDAAGLAPDERRFLVSAWLRRRFSEQLRPTGPAFWEPAYSAGIEALSFEVAVGDRLREELLKLYGSTAIELPEFGEAFRPLGPVYDFLPSAAQLELQQQSLQLVTAASPGFTPDSNPSVVCATTGLARLPPRMSGKPGTRLSESEQNELMLRVSPLADLLRRADAADSESSFRHLFALFSALEQRADPISQAELRRDIRQLTGDVVFDRIWSARDPLFGPLDSHLRQQGFSEDQILSVYTIVNQGQESIMDAIGRYTSDEARLAAIRRIRSDQSAQLARLLGSEQANALQAALHDAAVGLSSRTAAAC